MKRLTFVEVDIKYCSLSFGVGACNATGVKCFNTKATCKAPTKYTASTVTLRFASGSSYLDESGIDCVASCIEDVSYMPGTLSLGSDMGTRATVSVTMSDFPFADTGKGFDKYHAERDYDPFKQGTFWGKFRARHPFLMGSNFRLIRGYLGQDLSEMDVRHFIVDSFTGPGLNGRFVINAKDVLKLADGDRKKAPVASNGYLVSDITSSATTATIAPSGIGNIEYPASGYVSIGGKEICSFTRSGDTLTLGRAKFGTTAVALNAQDRVQLCINYSAADPADIIQSLLVTYADIPSSYINLTLWRQETSQFLRRLYTRLIVEPESVNTLVSELIEQAGLSVWWDESSRIIRLRVLRSIPTDAFEYNDDNIISRSLSVSEQPSKRISRINTYFGKRTPLEKDDETSYYSMQSDVNLESEGDYGWPSIKVIKSSWIPQFGRTVAKRTNEIQLGRFVDPPRQISFETFLSSDNPRPPLLGEGYRIRSRAMQTEFGLQASVPIQITRLMPTDTGFKVTAEEMNFIDFSTEDTNDRTIVIDFNIKNFDWYKAYIQTFPTPTAADNIICIVAPGVIVGSTSTSLPAFTVGTGWPSNVTLKLRVEGRIQGAGGNGGNASSDVASSAGDPGGNALHTRRPLLIETVNQIWSGGGGGNGTSGMGGSSAGGGGQGSIGGLGGVSTYGNGYPGTASAPGESSGGYRASRGGKAGEYGFPYGAPPGFSINGNSYVTITGSQAGILGPRTG